MKQRLSRCFVRISQLLCKQMKLIEINATYGIGSTGRIVADLIDEAKFNNIDVGVAYQSTDREAEFGFKVGNPVDRAWHGLMTRVMGRQGYNSRGATKKLIKWLDGQKPDVVHLHNLHSNYINLELLFSYLAKQDIATVITLHDCWFFTGKCCHFVESNCERWQTGCHDCPRNKLDIKSLFFDASARVWEDKRRLYEAVPRLYTVGCSKWITELARKSILSSGNVLQIYNGVDTDVFKPTVTDFKKRYGIDGKFITLGAANKWLLPENKALLDAYIKTKKDDEALVLFGIDESEKRSVPENSGVVVLGYITDKADMAELFASADVFINPTHADTLPTVNMEAAACGTPVITYDVCGSPELVNDGVTGYVVPEGDVLGVLCAKTAVRDGKISRDACRNHALSNFDKNANYKKYIELFKEIYNGETDLC